MALAAAALQLLVVGSFTSYEIYRGFFDDQANNASGMGPALLIPFWAGVLVIYLYCTIEMLRWDGKAQRHD